MSIRLETVTDHPWSSVGWSSRWQSSGVGALRTNRMVCPLVGSTTVLTVWIALGVWFGHTSGRDFAGRSGHKYHGWRNCFRILAGNEPTTDGSTRLALETNRCCTQMRYTCQLPSGQACG